jgi:hypothetical protein
VPNSFVCTCDSGYTGELCADDIDDCAADPCAATGTCADDAAVPNSFVCTCDSGYTGELCADDIDDCAADPCVATGTCADDGAVPNSFVCTCDSGYTGELCGTMIDYCEDEPCRNGTCSRTTTGFTCDCYDGFAGTGCQVVLLNDDKVTIQIVSTVAVNSDHEIAILGMQAQLAELTGAEADQFHVTLENSTDTAGNNIYIFIIDVTSTAELPAASVAEAVLGADGTGFEVTVLENTDDAEPAGEETDSVGLIVGLVGCGVVLVLGASYIQFKRKRTVIQNKDGLKYTLPV